MDYAVKRLNPGQGELPNYHLLDPRGTVLLVADQGVAGPDDRRQVRLARPDGKLLATIDLPETGTLSANNMADYAVVHDYAVYAILSIHRRTAGDDASKDGEKNAVKNTTQGTAHGAKENGHYLTLEVEGEKWLVLHHPELPHCFAIYDEIPAGLQTYDNITELDLPPSIGRICQTEDQHAFTANLDPYRLQQTGLVVLSLAYLLDRITGR